MYIHITTINCRCFTLFTSIFFNENEVFLQLSTSVRPLVLCKRFIYVIYCATENPLTENGAFDFMRAQHNIIVLMVIIDDTRWSWCRHFSLCIIIIWLYTKCLYYFTAVIGNLFKLTPFSRAADLLL